MGTEEAAVSLIGLVKSQEGSLQLVSGRWSVGQQLRMRGGKGVEKGKS